MTEYTVHLRNPETHSPQKRMVDSTAKRLIVRAGRRGGKTVGFAIRAVKRFLEGRRQLYAAPTSEQTDTFWFEIKRALAEPVKAGVFKQNESEQFIELPGTKQRIKAKTAWNADALRGDYADDLYLDEWQLMAEDMWDEVGAPMLLDNNGNAVFIYTPPSLKSSGVSKARDPRHASKMFKMALEDTTGLWETIHFTSLENPFISREGLAIITGDMSSDSYRHEILAQDDDIELLQLVYGKFNEDTCKVSRFPIPKEWPHYVGHDFGGANPAALFIAQDPATGYFYAYHEYLPGGGRSTSQHTDEFKKIVTDSNVLKRVGGSHQEQGEREAFTAHGWPIQEPKIQRVLPQIDRVVGLMELNKFFIFNDLYLYLEEIMNCLFKRDAHGFIMNEIEHEERYHLCACARYILSDFTPETVSLSNITEIHRFRR